MNKILIASILLSTAALGALADAAADSQTAERERKRAERRYWRDARRKSGTVRKANSAKGKIVFLNAQTRVPLKALDPVARAIKSQINPIFEIKQVEKVTLVNPQAEIKASGGNLGVVVVDTAELPTLLTAPEDGWAIVNVAPLFREAASNEVAYARTRKEILRGLALVGGAAFMTRDPIVMRADISSPKDLDLIKTEAFGIDVLMAFERRLPQHGVVPWYECTYLEACQEGWAPPPTNEYQKAVWDKVHAIPKNPMQIKYDPKKGR